MERLFIIDASGYLYRSYFAIRNMTNPKGESTNAIFGFIRSIQKLFKDFQPTHAVAVFDGPRNAASRTAIYPEYKGHRAAMPDDLRYQIAWAQEYCLMAGIPFLNIAGVEADDTMASIATLFEKQESDVYICTSDKDMCQVVTEKVKLLNTFKENKIIGIEEVVLEWGVPPNKMIDFLAMTGDSSDNVPGLSGFGPKTASDLIQKFGSLDEILANPEKVPGKKQETIRTERDKALISRQLVTVDCHVPVPIDNSFYFLKKAEGDPLKSFYTRMNFVSLIRELETAEANKPEAAVDQLTRYHLVDTAEELKDLITFLSKQKQIAFNTKTTQTNPMLAELVGLSFAVEPGEAWYVPTNKELGLDAVLQAFKPLFSNPAIGFYGHNVKADAHVLENHDIKIATISFDTVLASYLLNSHNRQHSLDQLALDYFTKVKMSWADVVGKGRSLVHLCDADCNVVCEYSCEEVDYICRLKIILEKQLQERQIGHLLYDLELPLSHVLTAMEREGIFLDAAHLQEMGKVIIAQLHILEEKIYQLAGESFNLNSPKQLSHILFEKMGIRPPKKTATGHSTNADVLEELSREYPIASAISEYRTLEKLRSTYIETLPSEINPHTGRIHCTFNQFVAATGRLSCQNPNLQNIPIRTEAGRQIREAFRPQRMGWSYLAADYSQIELRLLAHLSEDPSLLEAFNRHEDIHQSTAANIYGIPLESVTKEQRYSAKAVNFGLIYGQQSYGLSQNLGVDLKEAQRLIDLFYQRYPSVKSFLESCKQKARDSGKAVTVTGRERLIPEINSKNGQIRSAAERLAVNMPFQGTAADMIKQAMLKIAARLKSQQLKSQLILQIHDELVFEAPDEELPELEQLVREEMQGVMQLKIPLIVDVAIGKNWKEC